MVENVIESKGSAAEGFFELPLAKQLILFVGLAASIALGVYVVMWSKTPDYAPLYSQLSQRDAGDVVEALQRTGIPYKLDEASGVVMVEASKVQEARIKLAGLGVPSHSGSGFELLDKDSVFGASQLVERARYIRALEGELERTISSIDHIKSARVHLAIPKQTSFIKDKKDPSASVFVDIYGGYRLEHEQVAAITHLVASSIQGLSAQNVTVIDQNGKLLSSAGNDSISGAAKQLDYTHKLEGIYAKRIHDLLSPILGYDSVKAEVTATMDFTSLEETTENFDPQKTAIRSERLSDIEKTAADNVQGGVPGTLSNQPAAQGAKPAPAPAPAPNQKGKTVETPGMVNINKQTTRNFEIDRQIKHQMNLPGKLIRLSAAVVVDDKVTYDDKGNAKKTPLSKEEIQKIENLVKDAVGYDQARGDRVTIINSSFAQVQPIEDLPQQSIIEKPWFMTLVKQGLAGFIVVILIFVVLRPIVKNLTSIAGFKKGFLKQFSDQEGDGIYSEKKTRKLNEGEYHIRIKELIDEDPKKAAQIIKQWVGIEHEKGT